MELEGALVAEAMSLAPILQISVAVGVDLNFLKFILSVAVLILVETGIGIALAVMAVANFETVVIVAAVVGVDYPGFLAVVGD